MIWWNCAHAIPQSSHLSVILETWQLRCSNGNDQTKPNDIQRNPTKPNSNNVYIQSEWSLDCSAHFWFAVHSVNFIEFYLIQIVLSFIFSSLQIVLTELCQINKLSQPVKQTAEHQSHTHTMLRQFIIVFFSSICSHNRCYIHRTVYPLHCSTFYSVWALVCSASTLGCVIK